MVVFLDYSVIKFIYSIILCNHGLKPSNILLIQRSMLYPDKNEGSIGNIELPNAP